MRDQHINEMWSTYQIVYAPYFGEVIGALPHKASSAVVCGRQLSVVGILSACDKADERYGRPPEGLQQVRVHWTNVSVFAVDLGVQGSNSRQEIFSHVDPIVSPLAGLWRHLFSEHAEGWPNPEGWIRHASNPNAEGYPNQTTRPEPARDNIRDVSFHTPPHLQLLPLASLVSFLRLCLDLCSPLVSSGEHVVHLRCLPWRNGYRASTSVPRSGRPSPSSGAEW